MRPLGQQSTNPVVGKPRHTTLLLPEAKPLPDETILLALYKENADQARQHELFRQTITTLVAGITGAVIGLLSLKDTGAVLHSPLLPVIVILVAVIGTFGLIASMKHYERNRMHIERIREIRKALDTLPGITPQLLQNINANAKNTHDPKFPHLSQLELNKVWNTFHLLVVILGITLALLPCIYHPATTTSPAPTTMSTP